MANIEECETRSVWSISLYLLRRVSFIYLEILSELLNEMHTLYLKKQIVRKSLEAWKELIEIKE